MLQGIRVLDLSRVIAGPYAAALLGDLGADVIKVERPGRGDDMRSLRGDGRMSASFAAVNRNKRGIAVDLQKPEGARLAFELARRADVVLENFVPGVAERLGLGYAALSATNPAVVYASVSGYGQDGPYARRPGPWFRAKLARCHRKARRLWPVCTCTARWAGGTPDTCARHPWSTPAHRWSRSCFS